MLQTTRSRLGDRDELLAAPTTTSRQLAIARRIATCLRIAGVDSLLARIVLLANPFCHRLPPRILEQLREQRRIR